MNLEGCYQDSSDMNGYNTKPAKGKKSLPHIKVTHGKFELSKLKLLKFGLTTSITRLDSLVIFKTAL